MLTADNISDRQIIGIMREARIVQDFALENTCNVALRVTESLNGRDPDEEEIQIARDVCAGVLNAAIKLAQDKDPSTPLCPYCGRPRTRMESHVDTTCGRSECQEANYRGGVAIMLALESK